MGQSIAGINRQIDQWGADNLALLRSTDPAAVEKLDKERLATFIMSLEFRNPRRIAEFQAQAKSHVLGGCLSQDYSRYRRAHEPDTLEEYARALELPGLTEMCAEMIRTAVMMPSIREEILNLQWQVVTLANSEPLLTSDVSLIRYKGLRDDDGMLILPLSPTEFFVAYNHGKIDMKAWIDARIREGTFVPGINRSVIQQKIDYVYAADDSQKDFIAAHWKA